MKKPAVQDKNILNVGCFGAIRPLKNQLIQAVAARQYADKCGKKLRFHINATRSEQGGDNSLKNMRAMFKSWGDTSELVEHPWVSHSDFLEVVAGCDINLCVSFSETFCIVAADSVVADVPVVGSCEIPWITGMCQANPTDSGDIVDKMERAMRWGFKQSIKMLNTKNLRDYCETSKEAWLRCLLYNKSVK